MSELLKIYENVVKDESEAIQMEKRIVKEVDKITEPYEGTMTRKEFEKLRDLLFSVALTAEHEGFALGVRYAVKLLIECLS